MLGGTLGFLTPLLGLLGGAFAAATAITAAEDPRIRADTRANGAARFRDRALNSGPGGPNSRDLDRMINGPDVPAAPPVRPIQPARPAAAQRGADASGTITIRVDQEGRVTGVLGRPVDPRIRFNTDGTGLYMGGFA